MKLEAEKNTLEEEDEEKGEGDGKDRKEKKKELNMETQLIGPYHTKAITVLKELSSVPVVLSAGQDGEVIFWSLTNSTPFCYSENILSFVNIGEDITCGDLNKDENVLAIGTSKGIVMFY